MRPEIPDPGDQKSRIRMQPVLPDPDTTRIPGFGCDENSRIRMRLEQLDPDATRAPGSGPTTLWLELADQATLTVPTQSI